MLNTPLVEKPYRHPRDIENGHPSGWPFFRFINSRQEASMKPLVPTLNFIVKKGEIIGIIVLSLSIRRFRKRL